MLKFLQRWLHSEAPWVPPRQVPNAELSGAMIPPGDADWRTIDERRETKNPRHWPRFGLPCASAT